MKGYPQTSYDLSPTFSNSAELINQETAKEGKDYIYLSNKFKTVDFNLFQINQEFVSINGQIRS